MVVIGSGASGLAAALAAATGGASVTVLEKSELLGGTSAVSNGSLWIPNNRFMAEVGIDDSRDETLAYLSQLTLGRVAEDLLTTFVDNANPTVEFLEGNTGIQFAPNPSHPDYQSELAGAKPGGRVLQGGLFDAKRLGEFEPFLRRAGSALPITKFELESWGQDAIASWDWQLIEERSAQKITGMGTALVGELLEACLSRTVHICRATPALELAKQKDRVVGVVCQTREGPELIEAAGVVLASGGFEWNSQLVNRFLGLSRLAATSPPINIGDGLRMAMKVGAALGNMGEAWWAPLMSIPGETYEGQPLHRATTTLRSLPGGIMVNGRGRRFVDEAMNYNDAARAMLHFDPVGYRYPNSPAFLVFDQQFRDCYPVGPVAPDTPTPEWMFCAGTLGELAHQVGINAEGLEREVAAFNSDAEKGNDPAFGRGSTVYDRYRGDPTVKPNRNIRPLGPGPYYAIGIELGTIGTKGGPVTDRHGRVLDPDNHPIEGLFACGNVSASPFGPAYPGAGCTLSAGIVFGRLIGQFIAPC